MSSAEAASLQSEELGAAWDWYEMVQAFYQVIYRTCMSEIL